MNGITSLDLSNSTPFVRHIGTEHFLTYFIPNILPNLREVDFSNTFDDGIDGTLVRFSKKYLLLEEGTLDNNGGSNIFMWFGNALF
jgi:hypothetical protein